MSRQDSCQGQILLRGTEDALIQLHYALDALTQDRLPGNDCPGGDQLIRIFKTPPPGAQNELSVFYETHSFTGEKLDQMSICYRAHESTGLIFCQALCDATGASAVVQLHPPGENIKIDPNPGRDPSLYALWDPDDLPKKQNPATEPKIIKMASLSTIHLGKQDAAFLIKEDADPSCSSIAVYNHGGAGWIVYLTLPGDPDHVTERMPMTENIVKYLDWARDLGCNAIRFDPDGPVMPGLPIPD